MSVKNSDIQTDYVINVSGSIPMPAGTFAPFRLFTFGPFNIKGQDSNSHYKVSLGAQGGIDAAKIE